MQGGLRAASTTYPCGARELKGEEDEEEEEEQEEKEEDQCNEEEEEVFVGPLVEKCVLRMPWYGRLRASL